MNDIITINIESDFPIENGFDTVIPFDFALCDDGKLVITACECAAEAAKLFAGRYGDDPCAAEALAFVDSQLRAKMTGLGYPPDVKQAKRWSHIFRIDGPEQVRREAIRPDSALLTPDMSFKNLTTFDVPARHGEGLAMCGTLSDGALVSVAGENPRVGEGAVTEIGVETAVGWRGQGLAASNAALLALRLTEAGTAVTYVCSDRNAGSRRVAERAGFFHIGRMYHYVCYAE